MNNKRQLQIGELMKRSFASVLQEKGSYIYGSAFVSVTHVIVSPDLSQAKVYLSIFNADDKEEILIKIRNHTHVLKQGLVSKIRNQVRRIPQIFFYPDEMIDEMFKVDQMFKDLKTMYPTSSQEEE